MGPERRAASPPRGGAPQPLQLDAPSRVLSFGSSSLRLTPNEACVMLHLISPAPTAVSHETLWRAIRGGVPAVTTSAVRTLICELRRACRDVLGEDVIETVYAKGYRRRLDQGAVALTSVSEN